MGEEWVTVELHDARHQKGQRSRDNGIRGECRKEFAHDDE